MKCLKVSKAPMINKYRKITYDDLLDLDSPPSRMDQIYIDYVQDPENKDAVEEFYIPMVNKIFKAVFKLLAQKTKRKFYISPSDLLNSIIIQEDYGNVGKNVVVYISATPKRIDTIGIIIEDIFKSNTKIEEFEGNDEASSDSEDLVNDILGIGDKPVQVYASHTQDIVDQIQRKKLVPKGLFVSPSRKYAESYWGEDRVLFTTIIKMSDVSRHSEYDWMIKQDTKIDNIMVY